MFNLASTFFRTEGAAATTSLLTKKNILLMYLLTLAFNSLVFYFNPSGTYDKNYHLYAALLTLLMVPLAWVPRLLPYVVNLTSLLGVVLVTYVATQTGGIYSMTVVWLNLLALPVLLLLGPKATLAWMSIILLTLFGLFIGTITGVFSREVNMSPQAVPWTVMHSILAVASLMLGVRVYEYLHDHQLKQLNQRNEELKSIHQALLQAQAHKDEFVAAVGHELRTPMNAILGFNGVLRQELAQHPDQVEVVDHIRRSTTHLLQVVNDILDFSQLQAGQMQLHLTDFDLRELMNEVLDPFKTKAQRKGLYLTSQLDPTLPVYVRADRQRLIQILHNLLNNAFKFTDQGQVELRILRRPNLLRFEVADTGRGIPQALQTLIFRRFEHADMQTTRAYGGTGLGLSICEKLVIKQGGNIGVDSTEGHGACFWIEIPMLAARHQQKLTPAPWSDLSAEALRMLVVDDNAMNLMVAQLQLQKCWPKAQVVTANSGAEALALLAHQTFDVALVDMVMPDMDGMQLTQQIRQRFAGTAAHMPIIALTANTHAVERQRCLDAGMRDVLDKPMDLVRLVRVVTQNIEQARGGEHG
jgi:signal transduction histidine kinase/CheY-like chemotaxis protein